MKAYGTVRITYGSTYDTSLELRLVDAVELPIFGKLNLGIVQLCLQVRLAVAWMSICVKRMMAHVMAHMMAQLYR